MSDCSSSSLPSPSSLPSSSSPSFDADILADAESREYNEFLRRAYLRRRIDKPGSRLIGYGGMPKNDQQARFGPAIWEFTPEIANMAARYASYVQGRYLRYLRVRLPPRHRES